MVMIIVFILYSIIDDNIIIYSCKYFPFPLNNLHVEFKAAFVFPIGFRSVVPELQFYCVTILRIVCGYE